MKPIRLAVLMAAVLVARAQTIPVSFMHGVASGDPLPTSIIIWTRVTPRVAGTADIILPVTWAVSTRRDFRAVQATGTVAASAASDFTVKVIVGGLQPDAKYFFVFSVGPVKSPVGQFRLPLPAGQPMSRLRYAIFSCANWGWGYFNAYDAASQLDLDFFIHLGEFIYEHGADSYPSPTEAVRFQPPPLGLQPPTETVTLNAYRARYAFYRQDPGLQALSASAAMIAMWDDGEFANDAWVGGAEGHNPGEGSWADRKAAALQAYHEWLPTRPPNPANLAAFNRVFQYGNLATLFMLETRISARTNPVSGLPDPRVAAFAMGFAGMPPSQWTADMEAQARAFAAKGDAIRSQSSRSILGNQQLTWIREQTKNSLTHGTTWQLYGQGPVMLDQWAPDLEAAAANAPPRQRQLWLAVLANLTGAGPATTTVYTKTPRWSFLRGAFFSVSDDIKRFARIVVALGRYKININFDSWMGHQAEKSRFLAAIVGGAADAQAALGSPRATGPRPGGRAPPNTIGSSARLNAVVYGGDSHNAWVGAHSINGTRIATEFDVWSVTSPGAEDLAPAIPPAMVAAGFLANNPDTVWANTEDKGFMLVTLTRGTHRVEMMKLSTLASMNYRLSCEAAFEVRAGTRVIRRAACPPANGANNISPYSAVLALNSGLGRYSSALP